MFNTARIAPEMGGGYGEPVVLSLRDGRKGRPPYPKLYRHRIEDRPDFKQHITYGFPITTKTRPQIINQAEQWIRERTLPHMPIELILECKTFVRRDVSPSPRAADGANDDRVMALLPRAGDLPDLRPPRSRQPQDVERSAGSSTVPRTSGSESSCASRTIRLPRDLRR